MNAWIDKWTTGMSPVPPVFSSFPSLIPFSVSIGVNCDLLHHLWCFLWLQQDWSVGAGWAPTQRHVVLQNWTGFTLQNSRWVNVSISGLNRGADGVKHPQHIDLNTCTFDSLSDQTPHEVGTVFTPVRTSERVNLQGRKSSNSCFYTFYMTESIIKRRRYGLK